MPPLKCPAGWLMINKLFHIHLVDITLASVPKNSLSFSSFSRGIRIS